jgi:hypothetical protein
MALISCRECGESVSTKAVFCPHCGALQQPPMPPRLPVQPPPAHQMQEETIFLDNAVVVTNLRIIIGGATFALRNITSVKMLFTPPRLTKPILLLIVGFMILLAAFMPINANAPAPAGAFVIAGAIIVGAILWMRRAKTKYHISLLSAAGEVQVLTSKNRTYIEQIVLRINEAIVKQQ